MPHVDSWTPPCFKGRACRRNLRRLALLQHASRRQPRDVQPCQHALTVLSRRRKCSRHARLRCATPKLKHNVFVRTSNLFSCLLHHHAVISLIRVLRFLPNTFLHQTRNKQVQGKKREKNKSKENLKIPRPRSNGECGPSSDNRLPSSHITKNKLQPLSSPLVSDKITINNNGGSLRLCTRLVRHQHAV